MCTLCKATNRLARRAEEMSNRKPLPCTKPPKPEDLEKISTVLSEQAESAAQDAVALALDTGMRLREIAALRWQDIDFDRSSLSIPSRTHQYSRTIPMSESVAELLKKRRSASGKSEKVFSEGHHLLGSKVNRALRSACTAIGIPVISAYALRQAFAMKLARGGCSILALTSIMGYSPNFMKRAGINTHSL